MSKVYSPSSKAYNTKKETMKDPNTEVMSMKMVKEREWEYLSIIQGNNKDGSGLRINLMALQRQITFEDGDTYWGEYKDHKWEGYGTD